VDENLFEIRTPLGFRVHLTRTRWQLIVTTKHPVMIGREEFVRITLLSPDEVRQSRSDPAVFLFYRSERPRRWTCTVVKRVGEDQAFVITAYPTDAIKEGETIWIR
jgi:hypothetical protein